MAASNFITISKQVFKKLDATNSTGKTWQTSSGTKMFPIHFTQPKWTSRFPFSCLQFRSYKKSKNVPLPFQF